MVKVNIWYTMKSKAAQPTATINKSNTYMPPPPQTIELHQLMFCLWARSISFNFIGHNFNAFISHSFVCLLAGLCVFKLNKSIVGRTEMTVQPKCERVYYMPCAVFINKCVHFGIRLWRKSVWRTNRPKIKRERSIGIQWDRPHTHSHDRVE